jgi:hypothetical protein
MSEADPIEGLADRTGSSRSEAKGHLETFAGAAQAGWSPLPSDLPPGYALDASDPDLLLLLREDGTTAAAFSARGATVCGIMEAAERDVHPAPNGWWP